VPAKSSPDTPKDWPEISREIWQGKYRLKNVDDTPVDQTIGDTWSRVATGAAAAEDKAKRSKWQSRFEKVLADFRFLPAGRILAGMGTERRVTLFNCFVMGAIEDDLGSIFDNVKEAARTMQAGGGIGHDFSTLRPAGAPVRGVAADASGPVSFMDVWDTMCRSIMSAGARRGAMMGTLRCDHPDIEAFIDAKREAGRLRMFNLSVLVTDAFVEAVRADAPWDLVFEGTVYRTVKARDLWHRIMRATYEYAEPGVIFIDRVNAASNLNYCETISATNPCGEQPLPPYGACLLGSVNLAALVTQPFEEEAALDVESLRTTVATAVRLLDNVIDVSRYPLPEQEAEARAKRRIGLGLTGLANALAMTGHRYGTPEAAALAGEWMATIQNEAWRTSAALAEEKGAFPLYDRDAFLAAPGIAALESDVREAIATHGVRNGMVTSIAPTGTISLLAGNVSSGIEPVFDHSYERRVLQADGSTRTTVVQDYAYQVFRQKFGDDEALLDTFVTTQILVPEDHLRMQAALQPHVDSAISKTINCPEGIAFEAFESIYLDAFDLGLKGCTTYRPNAITGSVLATAAEEKSAVEPEPEQDAGHAAPRGGVVDALQGRRADGGVVYMAEPLSRSQVLTGATYKIKWPGSEHALYITINDIVQDERRRPFEIFINTKNLEHYAWIVALTRMISAVFRRGGDVSFVGEELKEVFDPRGGHWVGGKYVPSLIASIGTIIEQHMIDIGFLNAPSNVSDPQNADQQASDVSNSASQPPSLSQARFCPKCNAAGLIRQEGCWTCRNCGYAKCG